MAENTPKWLIQRFSMFKVVFIISNFLKRFKRGLKRFKKGYNLDAPFIFEINDYA